MLRTVKVYGHLAEHCGQSVFEALVRVPADAIKFLLCNFPELRSLMRDGYYKVAVGKFDLQLADHPEQLHYPMGADEVVKVIPVVSGAGGRGIGSILLGAALIGTALLTGGATLGLGGFTAAGTGLGFTAAAAAGNLGLALTLGGIAQMITPVPKPPEIGGEGQGGFAFSGLQNTSQEGIPVPVVYGEMIVGSVVLSTKLVADLVPNE
jgi:predicted phage tail protein|tara:strand:+ start:6144 stop:6767 length:624 start_codon:yes stop_codon:yes gene_type:complete